MIATLNLNGDYLSDALAAQVGGIGIAPGGNINYVSGHAIFEATHGTAPKYANQDKVNPGSVVLSGEMMFRYLGWDEAADLIIKGLNGAIGSKRVTYDFARLMEGRHGDQVLPVRRQHHRAHVGNVAQASAPGGSAGVPPAVPRLMRWRRRNTVAGGRQVGIEDRGKQALVGFPSPRFYACALPGKRFRAN